jgi:hypothetical protein
MSVFFREYAEGDMMTEFQKHCAMESNYSAEHLLDAYTKLSSVPGEYMISFSHKVFEKLKDMFLE